jgi:hypothetical protein
MGVSGTDTTADISNILKQIQNFGHRKSRKQGNETFATKMLNWKLDGGS